MKTIFKHLEEAEGHLLDIRIDVEGSDVDRSTVNAINRLADELESIREKLNSDLISGKELLT